MLKSYINDVCEILKIKAPELVQDSSKFESETMMAQVELNKRILYIKPFNTINYDILFAVAHELRHLWQSEKHPEMLKNYKQVNEFESVYNYNRQEAEMDANAFGTAVMNDFFKVKPLFINFGEDLKQEIYKRATSIEI